ncbi:prepilin-type N-terminal cleavage/methylation domain-containing protein [Ottowia thiooxydans]|uniref:prepilin-type N-terminal cleavage/methylation domain-containing protein n=1 Tax=Ottowia thiooxydans TaxID=219182 RepID=UPI0004011C79|nr:prepilin-type N-terminal cleavage/methylation domain-containing protein [Ottowia thiooxydans]
MTACRFADRPLLGAGTIRGFTLVEVLIALTLLSLLMLGLTGAMRAMSQTSEGIERRIDATDRLRVASALLNSVLSEASVRRLPDGANRQAIFFEATPNSLAWIGVMPARYGVGGRHYMRLALEGSQVVLRYAPWTGAPVYSEWASASAQVVAETVSGFDLRYLEPESLQWLAAWPPPDLRPNVVLPSAIEATIHGVNPPWPSLVVSVRGLAATDPSIVRGAWGP